MPEIVRPPIRYHGAKFRLAPWLLGFLPAHDIYVESFGGAAGLLLRKPRSRVEVYNDLDEDVVGFFRVLRDPMLRERLMEAIELTPLARREFELAYLPAEDPVERARRLVIRSQMGFGSAGATKGRTGWRGAKYHMARMGEWARATEPLRAAAERFSGVVIECREAVDVITAFDGAETLHFVDPPYLHETRSDAARTPAYRHELSEEGHGRLLDVLRQVVGRVVLCGYAAPLYAALERDGWRRESAPALAAGRNGGVQRTECVWLNPAAQRAAKQQRLIA